MLLYKLTVLGCSLFVPCMHVSQILLSQLARILGSFIDGVQAALNITNSGLILLPFFPTTRPSCCDNHRLSQNVEISVAWLSLTTSDPFASVVKFRQIPYPLPDLRNETCEGDCIFILY